MTTQYNVVTYGDLINTNGVLSGFSGSNYATIPLNFNPVQRPFEVVFKFAGTNGVIWNVGDLTTPRGHIEFEIYQSKLYAEAAANTALIWSIDGVTTLSPNTNYWVKLAYNGVDTYSLYLSADGITWNTEGTATSSAFLADGSTEYNLIGVQAENGGVITYPFDGSIDLNESYISIDNVRWWQGVTSTSTVQTRIQLRHDTSANWTSVNPVLLEGEVGIETDTLKQKVGDGSTAWNSLSYQSDIFVAEYDVTPFADIKTAYDAGKTILCVGNGVEDTAIGVMNKYSYVLIQGGTGECTFYSALGTVIFTAKAKLTRGTTTWESSFAELSTYDLSNVTSIDANSAVQTALDAKVNKSGDTMTGALELNVPIPSGDNTIKPIVLKNTGMTVGTVPSSATFTTLQFSDINDAELARMTLRNTTTERELVIINTGFNGNTSTFKIGMNTSNMGYCTFPNTACVDGQWVASYQEAIGTTAQTINAQSLKSITFTNLPAKNCEILFTISQSTNFDLAIYSDLIGSTTNRALRQGCICMILPVSSNKTIKVQNLGSGTASISFVRMMGYRVLGTNVNA